MSSGELIALQIDGSIIGIVIVVFLALLSLAYGYGMLNQRVKHNKTGIDEHTRICNAIDGKLDDVILRVSRIETVLKLNGGKLNGKRRK